MNTQRRNFIKNSSLATGGLFFSPSFKKITALFGKAPELAKALDTITIFHTNDLHNQIQPRIQGHLNGYGGLKSIREILQQKDAQAILVDAGDFLDDRASMLDHKEMIEVMNQVGYNAATIGNKELTKGQAYLAELMKEMNFKLVNCNYSFSHSYLKANVLPYTIFKWGQYKVGITGVGTDLDAKLKSSENIIYHHPYERANAIAYQLKKQNQCDLVICLSHLGYRSNQGSFNNSDFAFASESIDIIISGHNQDLIGAPKVLKNKNKEEVILSHGGWGGLISRQLSVTFSAGQRHLFQCKSYVPAINGEELFYESFKKISA